MKQRISMFLILILLATSTVTYAASENSVNYTPRVRVDHLFTQEDAPRLRIEESNLGDFREDERIRLHLENAEWKNIDQIPADTQVRGSATGVRISRVTSRTLQVTLEKDESINEKAGYQIPIYAEATAGGYATVRIEAWTGGVTAETLNFAGVVGPEKTGEQWLREDMPGHFEEEKQEEKVEEEPEEIVEEPEIPEEPIEPEEPAEPEEPSIPSEVIFFVDETGYIKDGIQYPTDVAPFIKSLPGGTGRTMMPLHHVSLALGAEEVIWDEKSRSVTVHKGEDTLQLKIDEPELLINNEVITMDTPAIIQPTGDGLGRTMIPVAHLAQALSVEYQWNPEDRSVTFQPLFHP
ncbi:Copper amine oxidase N-terminal domain-containing protein [Tindallia magadiensis]|uniref:Copper amine oxidase N-terminal domain-containing protein n=1 Tax=Tindallia magadiensis TaxID=69895 RepID=A0A1I3D285_9FIRM|nr:stalk domain-containing protein [Tindallia magadiensis]SFH80611.1 Copper amine oxidase N-terminal domain-containing protein [Tindallia magadiensis]